MYKIDYSPAAYTPLFCEENIWKLIQSLYTNKQIIPIDVLFILNRYDSIALFNQKKSNGEPPVIWDYHVILVAKDMEKYVIYDYDSKTELGTPINQYFQQTFPLSQPLNETYQPLIKPINAAFYFQHFYSNRQHMINIIDKYLFPQSPIIEPDKNIEKLTLKQCRTITNDILLPYEYLKKYTN